MITKELLNKNRVLTMSNNRKCDYLVVDFGRSQGSEKIVATMMGINAQGVTKDILVLKTFEEKSIEKLVNEAYWICKEFNIQRILVDCLGFGVGFIDTFKEMIPDRIVSIRSINILSPESKELYQSAYFQIEKDLQYGHLRFLQSPELADTSYQKSFLGYSNIMQYHYETNELIEEIANIKLDLNNGTVKLGKIDDSISKSRITSLLVFYSYPSNCIQKEQDNNQYELIKRMAQYNVIHGTFYKYMFKSIENENLNTIFYYKNRNKIEQFKNITQEKDFKELFIPYIKNIRITKEDLEIYFFNGSSIKFKVGSDSSRGCRYHFAVVDTDIEYEVFANAIGCKGILFDMAKRDGLLLNDNYNVEFIQM